MTPSASNNQAPRSLCAFRSFFTLVSMPSASRPKWFATASVVPSPTKGSTTHPQGAWTRNHLTANAAAATPIPFGHTCAPRANTSGEPAPGLSTKAGPAKARR